jgi:hypothetical protein
MSRRKKRSVKHPAISRQTAIGFIVILAILLLGGWKLYANHHKKSYISTTSSGSYVNLSPPTQRDKQDLGDSSATQPPPPSSDGKLVVAPVITSADSTSVKAFIQGVVEDGGTCTAKLSQGATNLTFTSDGFVNASYTSCAPINITPALSKGSWTVTVSYSSSKAAGTSKPQTIEVN